MKSNAVDLLAPLIVLMGVVSGVSNARSAQLLTEEGFPTLAPLIEKVTPAVVNISVSSLAPAQQNPLLRDPFFKRFFDQQKNIPKGEPPQRRFGAGSGVIVDARMGYVLTNHHVIDGAAEIFVTLKDRRRLEAKLLGSDPLTDIAVLKIEPDGLRAIDFGDSDALDVGDFVIAVGNPFGLGQTVTAGIVSALGRSGINPEGFEDFIQTDAPINPGNSGGALITLSGEVIGINTAIIAPSGGNVGIGFAVPSNMARAVMAQIVEFGKVRRGRLGVSIQDLTPELAKVLGLNVTRGAVVTQVEKNSAAEMAGMRPGDVILEANDKVVDGSADLRATIGIIPFGENVDFVLIRDGKRLEITAQLTGATEVLRSGSDAISKFSGVSVRALEPKMPMYGKVEGVVVGDIDTRSPAARRGLRLGDVITSVNRKAVKNVIEFKKAIETARGRVVALHIVRGDTRMFLVI